MLSVTFSLPLHFPFSILDCLLSLWVSLVLGVAGLQWFFVDRGSLRWIMDHGISASLRWIVDRGSLRWIVDLFSVSFNFVGF